MVKGLLPRSCRATGFKASPRVWPRFLLPALGFQATSRELFCSMVSEESLYAVSLALLLNGFVASFFLFFSCLFQGALILLRRSGRPFPVFAHLLHARMFRFLHLGSSHSATRKVGTRALGLRMQILRYQPSLQAESLREEGTKCKIITPNKRGAD